MKLNTDIFSVDLVMYLKIKNSDVFGGKGSTGYTTMTIEDIQKYKTEAEIIAEVFNYYMDAFSDFAVSYEDIEILTRDEYEEAMEEDDFSDYMDEWEDFEDEDYSDTLPCGCCACCGCSCDEEWEDEEEMTDEDGNDYIQTIEDLVKLEREDEDE